MVNQHTPYGSTDYAQTGTTSDGTPQFTGTTTLSPQLGGLVDKGISNAQGNANLEGSLLGNSSANLSHPLDLSYGATEQHLDELGRHTLDPQFQQGQDQLEQKLYNQGVRPGSEAYNNQMGIFNHGKAQAYDGMYLGGHQQAVSDLQAAYNSPLNALTALRSNSQVSQPGIGAGQPPTPQTSVQGTNVAGIYNQAYQDQASQSSAAMGGLFGLGGSAIGAAGMFF